MRRARIIVAGLLTVAYLLVLSLTPSAGMAAFYGQPDGGTAVAAADNGACHDGEPGSPDISKAADCGVCGVCALAPATLVDASDVTPLRASIVRSIGSVDSPDGTSHQPATPPPLASSIRS